MKEKSTDSYLLRIAGNLKTLRKRRRYSQHELARRAHVSRAQISNMERMAVTNTGLAILGSIARSLNVDVVDLLVEPK